MAKKSSQPDEPDLAILLVAANRVLVDRLMAAMDRAGLTMRPSWGPVNDSARPVWNTKLGLVIQ